MGTGLMIRCKCDRYTYFQCSSGIASWATALQQMLHLLHCM